MSNHDEQCPVNCRCNGCKAEEIQRERTVSEAAVLATAIKLLEALTSPCEVNAQNGRHTWNKCRRCLAVEEIDIEHWHVMFVAVLRRLRGEA